VTHSNVPDAILCRSHVYGHVVRARGRLLGQRGTCLTALLPGETVGNTAPIWGQANVQIHRDTWAFQARGCWYGHPRSRRTHLHATPNMAIAHMHMHMQHIWACVHACLCTCDTRRSRWQCWQWATRATAQTHGSARASQPGCMHTSHSTLPAQHQHQHRSRYTANA